MTRQGQGQGFEARRPDAGDTKYDDREYIFGHFFVD